MEERVGSGSLRHTLGHAKGFDLDLKDQAAHNNIHQRALKLIVTFRNAAMTNSQCGSQSFHRLITGLQTRLILDVEERASIHHRPRPSNSTGSVQRPHKGTRAMLEYRNSRH